MCLLALCSAVYSSLSTEHKAFAIYSQKHLWSLVLTHFLFHRFSGTAAPYRMFDQDIHMGFLLRLLLMALGYDSSVYQGGGSVI